MKKISVTDAVSETLFINIPVKAKENHRPSGILRDPFSAELINKLDYDFSKFATAAGPATGVVVRAQYFDQETAAFIAKNKDKDLVVVHIGAGLDTRFLRIGGARLPATFYELDLPDVMDLRETVLPPADNEHIIKSSMLETDWMDELSAKHPDAYFLFVLEGVSFYFPEEKIKQLFCGLAQRFSGEILCDLISVWICNRSNKKNILQGTEASFVFGVDDEKLPETWSPRIKRVKTEYLMKRHPGRWGFLVGRVLSHIPAVKNSSKLVTYRLG